MMEDNVLKRVIIVICSIALVGCLMSCCLKESMVVKEVTWSCERTIYQWSKVPHTYTTKKRTDRYDAYNDKLTAIRNIENNKGYDICVLNGNEPYQTSSNNKTEYYYTIDYIKDEWKQLNSSACKSQGDYTVEPYDPEPIYNLRSEFELHRDQKIGDMCCDDYVTKKYFVHGTCYDIDVTYTIQEADFNKLKEASASENEMEIWFSTDPSSQYAYNISFEEFD